MTMTTRQLKALEIAARCRILLHEGTYLVPSQQGNGTYQVRLDESGSCCSCDDFESRRHDCKHILAARLVRQRDGGQASADFTSDTPPRRPTYRQNWPAYNQAQTTEKKRFLVLLRELCTGISEPPPPRVGRRPVPLKDIVLACTLKVYSTFSTRRFHSDLQDLHAQGYLSRPVHCSQICAFLQRDTLTAVLQDLIVQSSLPLVPVETQFAPDSSGFSTSRYVRWYDEKYGETRSGSAHRDWLKVHLICGVKTNVVTMAEIRERDSADSPLLPTLLKTTAEHFRVEEVSADKAYSSQTNLEAVVECGAFPYIPFKSNTTGGAGGLWSQLFGYYTYKREEFLDHYHKRSNVESTISMIKAKFHEQIRSRGETAQKNEVLCKILCHNICVLIQSQCELGIEANFWQDKEVE